MTPNLYTQDSIYEVLSDVRNNIVESEDVWVNYNDEEIRLNVNKSGLTSLKSSYQAKLVDNKISVYKDEELLFHILTGPKLADLDVRPVTCCLELDNLVFSALNGTISVYNLKSKDVYELGEHVVYTNLIKFFPSKTIVLTAGLDYKLKLWNLKTRSEIQQLSYQRGTIDDALMIGKGRNLLTACKSDLDRGLVLWEVGKPQVLREFKLQVECMTLIPVAAAELTLPDLYDCEDKLAVIGTPNSTLLLDLRSLEYSELFPNGSQFLGTFGTKLVRQFNNELFIYDFNDFKTPIHILSGWGGAISLYGEYAIAGNLALNLTTLELNVFSCELKQIFSNGFCIGNEIRRII